MISSWTRYAYKNKMVSGCVKMKWKNQEALGSDLAIIASIYKRSPGDLSDSNVLAYPVQTNWCLAGLCGADHALVVVHQYWQKPLVR
jgi:hypothetical protein